jgi:hypothetical protein
MLSTPERSDLSPAAEVSWLAIRQPAVIRFLESRLGSDDGDALAAGLELAVRVLAQIERTDEVPVPRLHIRQLDYGVAAHMNGVGDTALTDWAWRQLDRLPIVLEAVEARRVVACTAAILGAALEMRAIDADDMRVE